MMKHFLSSLLGLILCAAPCLAQNPASMTQGSASMVQNQDIEVVTRNGKQYYQYVVQPKETIYGLSKRFHISQEELLAMNPFLSEGLKIGHVLTIPVRLEEAQVPARMTKLADTPTEQQVTDNEDDGDFYHSDNEQIYTVSKRKEKIFEIAQKFNVDIATIRQLNPRIPNTLRKGSVVILPNKQVEELTQKVEHMQSEIDTARDSVRTLLDRIQHLMAQEENSKKDKVSVALLLPFMIGDTTGISNERYVEFYEGLLMAADTLKKSGLSVHIEAYDIGNTLYRSEYCLKNNNLTRHDFIIAAANADQLPLLSAWSLENKVKLVLPFSSRIAESENNPYIYQINAPQPLINEKVLAVDTSKFAGKNVILLRTPNELNDDKGQLFKATRRQLIDHRIKFHEVIEYQGDEYYQDSIAARLSNQKPNLIIPCASSLSETNRLISTVAAIINFLPSSYKVEMWGYPEWVALSKSNLPVLHNLNTSIYGNYFANFNLDYVRQFQIDYSMNYGKDLMNTYPRYAMMGHDIMVHFSELASRQDFNIRALQHEMKFEQKKADGGWYNTNVYIIQYQRNEDVKATIMP